MKTIKKQILEPGPRRVNTNTASEAELDQLIAERLPTMPSRRARGEGAGGERYPGSAPGSIRRFKARTRKHLS